MCKCREKRKRNIPQSTPDVKQVSINLVKHIGVPIKFPDAHNGKDVYIVNRKSMAGTNGSIVIYGRSGYAPEEVKESLLQKWPGLFI